MTPFGARLRSLRAARGMTAAELAKVADGRVFSGRQSIPLKLVDELGAERQAISWLETAKGVTKDLPVEDWKPKSGRGLTLWSALGTGASLLGLNDLAERLDIVGEEGVVLARGGMLALWRPEPAEIR